MPTDGDDTPILGLHDCQRVDEAVDVCGSIHRAALDRRRAVHLRVSDDVRPGYVNGPTDDLPESSVSGVFAGVIPRQILKFPDIDPSSAA